MNRYQDRLARIRTAAQVTTLRLWDDLPDYNKPRIDGFTNQAVPVVRHAQRLAVNTTASALRRPRLVIPKPTQYPRPVPPEEVYARPFGKVWKALGDGKPLEQAIAEGRSYLAQLSLMDVALAVRQTYQEIGDANASITVWVRVADGGACDLCSASDGETYSDASDMGLHPGCGCTLEPGSTDSGPADGSATTTHDSDELGALLYESGHDFAAA